MSRSRQPNRKAELLPLLPAQRWFFKRGWEQRERFNQAVLLEVKDEWVVAVLGQVMEALERHHGGLRMRFQQNGEGVWQQWVSREQSAGLMEMTSAVWGKNRSKRRWPR